MKLMFISSVKINLEGLNLKFIESPWIKILQLKVGGLKLNKLQPRD